MRTSIQLAGAGLGAEGPQHGRTGLAVSGKRTHYVLKDRTLYAPIRGVLRCGET